VHLVAHSCKFVLVLLLTDCYMHRFIFERKCEKHNWEFFIISSVDFSNSCENYLKERVCNGEWVAIFSYLSALDPLSYAKRCSYPQQCTHTVLWIRIECVLIRIPLHSGSDPAPERNGIRIFSDPYPAEIFQINFKSRVFPFKNDIFEKHENYIYYCITFLFRSFRIRIWTKSLGSGSC